MLATLFARPQTLFDQLDAMQRLLSQSPGGNAGPSALRSVAHGAFPEINVGRGATSIEVFVFAPGLDAASIDVTVERNVLKISGTRASGIPQGEGRVQLYANERPDGRFARGVSLPDDADTSRIDARYRNGILRISVALSAAAQPQRIAVQ
jgi:HSP20 family protein